MQEILIIDIKLAPDALATTAITTHQIKVIPNPTTNILSIQGDTTLFFDKISISDATGKVILEQNQSTNQINVEQLASGMYFIQASSNKETYTAKFIKKE